MLSLLSIVLAATAFANLATAAPIVLDNVALVNDGAFRFRYMYHPTAKPQSHLAGANLGLVHEVAHPVLENIILRKRAADLETLTGSLANAPIDLHHDVVLIPIDVVTREDLPVQNLVDEVVHPILENVVLRKRAADLETLAGTLLAEGSLVNAPVDLTNSAIVAPVDVTPRAIETLPGLLLADGSVANAPVDVNNDDVLIPVDVVLRAIDVETVLGTVANAPVDVSNDDVLVPVDVVLRATDVETLPGTLLADGSVVNAPVDLTNDAIEAPANVDLASVTPPTTGTGVGGSVGSSPLDTFVDVVLGVAANLDILGHPIIDIP
ncbi:hypothetical protein H0H93_007370 [Arthromyces matolae]|nr:hypothetical protein H0H93_007370 [Arthromyces matolae]